MTITALRLRPAAIRLNQFELGAAPAVRGDLTLAGRHANETFHRPIRVAGFA